MDSTTGPAPAQASTPQLRDSPQRWWLAALLVSSMMVLYAHRGALSIAAPYMIKELNLSTAVMGALLSAFFWSYWLMQVPAGWLVDRFGARRAYALGFAFWSISSAFTGLVGGLAALMFVRMLVGVGQAVAFPASARAVANWFRDKERGTVTGAYLSGVRLGQALIAAIGVFLLAKYGWKGFFIAIGLPPLIWILPWMLFLKKWEVRENGAAPGTPRGAAAAAPKPASFLQSLALLRERTVLGIFLGFFAYDYAWFVFLTWLPGYLKLERGFSDREMAIYSAVPFVAMSLVIVGSGVLSDFLIRRGLRETLVRKWLIAVGLAVACLIVPAGLVEDKMTAVWLLSISLCGLGISSPNTWTLTQAVCSRRIVGTVSGIQNFGGNLGGVLAPSVTGLIAHQTQSFSLALTLTGVILVGGILSYWLLIGQRVEPPSSGPEPAPVGG